MEVNSARFLTVCREIALNPHILSGIGTYAEKRIHLALKIYFEPREDKREVKCGSYIADILNEDGIIEIQTANFNSLNDKLRYFTEQYDVKVIYPVADKKTISWIDPADGSISKKNPSPKRGSFYSILPELIHAKESLTNSRVKYIAAMMDIDEYRLLSGKSRDRKKWGARKYDSVPVSLNSLVEIGDYKILVPPELPDFFTIRDFSAAAKLSYADAQTGIMVLRTAGVLELCGKRGRQNFYKRTFQ